MATWQHLQNELDLWEQAEIRASFWWRDDDAGAATSQLKQLVQMANGAKIPLHLAVIPTNLTKEAKVLLNQSAFTKVLQHGYSHTDFAPSGAGSWELGMHRPISTVSQELARGSKILATAFASKFLPVLVPPWNRIDETVIAELPSLGFKGLSREGNRSISTSNSLIDINTHCDPIKWKYNAEFKGANRVLEDIVKHLYQRRNGICDRNEPTGICTHHLDHDDQLWAFLQVLFDVTASDSAVDWVCIDQEIA